MSKWEFKIEFPWGQTMHPDPSSPQDADRLMHDPEVAAGSMLFRRRKAKPEEWEHIDTKTDLSGQKTPDAAKIAKADPVATDPPTREEMAALVAQLRNFGTAVAAALAPYVTAMTTFAERVADHLPEAPVVGPIPLISDRARRIIAEPDPAVADPHQRISAFQDGWRQGAEWRNKIHAEELADIHKIIAWLRDQSVNWVSARDTADRLDHALSIDTRRTPEREDLGRDGLPVDGTPEDGLGTSGGVPITEEMIKKFADKAEAGYDLDDLPEPFESWARRQIDKIGYGLRELQAAAEHGSNVQDKLDDIETLARHKLRRHELLDPQVIIRIFDGAS